MTDIDGLEPHVQAGNAVARKFDEQFVHSLKCKNCGYIRFPAPTPEVLEEYYQTVFPKKSASWYNVDDSFSDWKRVPRADRILSLAEKFHLKPGIFHEVGCAFGGTVFELSLRGFVSTGSDLNEAAVEQGRVRGAEIFSADEQHILESIHRRPTVIYGFHVLAHIADPIDYLRSLANVADDKDAIMIFFVPNAMAAFPLVHGYARYAWYAYPEHLHLFSPRSLLCLAEAADLTLLHVAATPYNVHKEETSRILQPIAESKAADQLRDYAMQEAMILPELEFVVARPDSDVAVRFAASAYAAKQRCLRAEAFEKSITTLMKSAPAVAP